MSLLCSNKINGASEREHTTVICNTGEAYRTTSNSISLNVVRPNHSDPPANEHSSTQYHQYSITRIPVSSSTVRANPAKLPAKLPPSQFPNPIQSYIIRPYGCVFRRAGEAPAKTKCKRQGWEEPFFFSTPPSPLCSPPSSPRPSPQFSPRLVPRSSALSQARGQ